MSFSYSFPVTNTAPGETFIGNVTVPAGSAHPNRKINITVPVGFQFIGEDTTATSKTFTVNVNRDINLRVRRSGSSGTYALVNTSRTSNVTTKSFVKSATAGPFSLNCYFYNLNVSYTPPTSNADWTYEFYLTFSYTLNSTESLTVNSLPGCYASVVVGTTVGTSEFSSNITYASGSSNTAGYVPFSIAEAFPYNNVWNGTGTGYAPSAPTTWTGLQECDVIYSNNQYVAQNLSLKNTVGTNMLQWLNTDANLGSIMGSISSSLVTNSMNFVSNLANGFSFTGPVNFTSAITGPTITNINNDIATINSNLTLKANALNPSFSGTLTAPAITTQNISNTSNPIDISASPYITMMGGNVQVEPDGTVLGKAFIAHDGINTIDSTGVTCTNLVVLNPFALPIQATKQVVGRANCRIRYNGPNYSLVYNYNFGIIPGSSVYVDKVASGVVQLFIPYSTGLPNFHFTVSASGSYDDGIAGNSGLVISVTQKSETSNGGVAVGYSFKLIICRASAPSTPVDLASLGRIDVAVFW